MKKLTVFNRTVLALSFGCALATLPVSVRAQDDPSALATPTGPSDTKEDAHSTVASTTGKDVPKVSADKKFTESDKVIARKFANGNFGEITEGELALKNAESPEIKEFAQKMIDEHGKANQELIAIANAHGMDLKPELTDEEKAAHNKMLLLKGTNFDGQYAKHAVADHQDDVKEYKKDVTKIKDKELLAYAQKTLPIVEEHEKMAQGLKGAASIGGEAKAAKQKKE